MTRYQAYQTRLAHHAIGETFTQATAFLGIAAGNILSHARTTADSPAAGRR